MNSSQPLKTTNSVKAWKKADTPLTAEILRSLPGCEHYSQEQAARIVETIRKFSEILLDHIRRCDIWRIDNQPFVYLEDENGAPGAAPVKTIVSAKNKAA